ncbi:MAG: hypothetical protein NVS1B10_03140 [Candidatus Saccharimonadales bacterium]
MAPSSVGVRNDIKRNITLEAVRQGVNPQLAYAVAVVESGLNIRAVGSRGEKGLFQLMPRTRNKKALVDWKENIKEGISQLRDWSTTCPTKENYTYVICYNQGNRHPKFPYLHPYYLKVMQAMR